MPVAVGSTLQDGKYRLDAVLGEGGFGITYRATHTLLQQVVVVKTLKSKHEDTAEFSQLRQRFMTEARTLAQFQHPHIVRVIDCFVEAGLPFIVMDYIPGNTLGDLSRNRPMPEAEAIAYIRQVGLALQEIHKQGLVHRDVKPENIILRKGTNQVILIDFGIARHFTPGLTETNTGMVSEGYAPIEQYLPRHQWTPATDVYALAATLYTLLSGQPPVASVLRDRLPLINLYEFQPNLNAVVKQAVLRGMAMEVSQRPASINAWLRLLPAPTEPLPTPTVGNSTHHNSTHHSAIRTASTVSVLPGGKVQQEAPVPNTKLQGYPELRANLNWGDSTDAEPETVFPRRRASVLLPMLLTAAGAAILGAGAGLVLRSHPVPSWGPTLLQQHESFPEKIPPAQRPVPPIETYPTPELNPSTEDSALPIEPVNPTPSESVSPEPDLTNPSPTPSAKPSANDGGTTPEVRPQAPVESATPFAPNPVEPIPTPEPAPTIPEAAQPEAPVTPAPATP
jgi:serine/threonine-protein kinase